MSTCFFNVQPGKETSNCLSHSSWLSDAPSAVTRAPAEEKSIDINQTLFLDSRSNGGGLFFWLLFCSPLEARFGEV